MRTLIVEDEFQNKWIQSKLVGWDHDVDWALDTEEADEYLLKRSYDLIILDILMPAPSVEKRTSPFYPKSLGSQAIASRMGLILYQRIVTGEIRLKRLEHKNRALFSLF